jgi:hypothetical protein
MVIHSLEAVIRTFCISVMSYEEFDGSSVANNRFLLPTMTEAGNANSKVKSTMHRVVGLGSSIHLGPQFMYMHDIDA